MLSPRILHFTKDQIFWDCSTISACEAIPTGLPQPLDERASVDRHWRERLQQPSLSVGPLAGTADDSLERAWKMAVRVYTSCNLTQASDKSKAIWGVAKLMRDAMEDDYGEGLFAARFGEQLAWRVSDCRDPRLRQRNSMFPSWTWMSVNGTVEVADRWQLARVYEARDHSGALLALELDQLHFPQRSYSWASNHASFGRKFQRSDSLRSGTSDGSDAISHTSQRRPKESKDTPSCLRSPSLAIRCHIGKGELCKDGDESWQVKISHDLEPEAVHVTAFPDVAPVSSDSPIQFLILAVSKYATVPDDEDFYECSVSSDSASPGESVGEHEDEGYGEQDAREDVDSESHSTQEEAGESGEETRNESDDGDGEWGIYDCQFLYSGVGLLVETTDGVRYRRTGAVAFRDVSAHSWRAIRVACGEAGNLLMEDMDPSNGQAVFLD
jgi:hypothetical protein